MKNEKDLKPSECKYDSKAKSLEIEQGNVSLNSFVVNQ